MTETVKRIALFFTPTTAHVHWVTLDQTGQPPRVVEDIGIPRFELVSLDDAPLAIYRADTGGSYERDALAALAELIRVVNGEPNVSVDVDEQLRQLREQLRATTENAQETFNKYEATIARQEIRVEKIIEQARRWKGIALRREQYIDSWKDEDRKLRSAITQRDTELRASRREIAELQDQLQVARNAVERSVNRANHSNEHVDRARQEAASLRQQLGQATAEAHDLRERIATVQANALDTINRVAAALPGPVVDAEIVEPPFEIDTFYSADGDVPVVEISTTAISGRIRVNLNEGVIWDGDPDTDERPGAHAEPEEFSNEAARAADGSTISRQLDTIREQTEKIERLENERDELVQALKNRNGEGDPADPGAHGGAIPRYGMLDLWMAIHGSESSTEFEEFYDRVGYADAWSELLGAVRSLNLQKETHRSDAKIFMEERNEAARNLSQCSAERAEAWRELERYRDRAAAWERVYYHPNLRQFTEEDGIAVEQVMEGISKLAEWRETIREQYVQTVAERDAARADTEKLREINEVQRRGIDESERSRREALQQRDDLDRKLTESENMRRRLDARLGEERDAYIASSTALQSVIRNYDGLAQCGANLARAVTAERPDLGEAGSLGRAYLREMAARFGA